MVIRAAKASEHEELASLQQIIFRPKEPQAVDRYLTYVREDSSYRPDQSRVVIDGGRIVAHLRVWDRTTRVRGADLYAGGIGSLLVRPDCRGRGYAHALLRDTERYFFEYGYDIGLLFTIIGPPFYAAQGWTPIPLPTFELDVRDLSITAPSGCVRPLAPSADLADVEAIYAEAGLGYAGSVIRPPDYLVSGPARMRGSFPKLGVDVDGRLGAYVSFSVDEASVWVTEACARTGCEGAYADLVRALLLDVRPAVIEGSLPRSHAFVRVLEAVTGRTATWGTHDEMMVKLANWRTVTEKLGGSGAPSRPPEDEGVFWLSLFGLDAAADASLQAWMQTLPPSDETFYWWTDIF